MSSRRSTPARYDFAHALIRDTLYGGLNPDRRARLHLRTAQALERGHITDDLVAALATHYRLAGRLAAPEHSIDYAVKAGEVAQAGFAYEDAVTHWQTALDLMEVHPVKADRLAALYEKLGDQLLISDPGDERALTSHERAVALYEQVGDIESATRVNFRIAILFSTIASERQDVPRALRHARAAASSMSPDDQALRAQVEATYSCACFFSLQLEDALAASQRAMDALAELDLDTSAHHHRDAAGSTARGIASHRLHSPRFLPCGRGRAIGRSSATWRSLRDCCSTQPAVFRLRRLGLGRDGAVRPARSGRCPADGSSVSWPSRVRPVRPSSGSGWRSATAARG